VGYGLRPDPPYVSADPLTRNLSQVGEGKQSSRITAPEAHWPKATPKAGRSTAGKPGSHAGKGRRR